MAILLDSISASSSDKVDKNSAPHKKFQWYWIPIFCAVWFLLFYVTVIPSFYSYPSTLKIADEHKHRDEFIGERAERNLMDLANIGEKMAGSYENEVLTVQYLLNIIQTIKSNARLDLYNIDVDLQYASGSFMYGRMATSYRNISNIAVKIESKLAAPSKSYLLVNSHYDSVTGSPGAADAGVMIVIMLETLRVISTSEKPLKHGVVFLLNGAEESNLLGSHAFITQHKWAANCKALINLDSAGSGGREVLFQSGPGHPWLMKYYKQSAKHPYATTIAEELFQNDFIPSDTDFRIFRDYGNVPGLDMAHTYNGYVYHTKYDTFLNLEKGTCQTTGDNVLALTWALANAEEMYDTKQYAEGHVVYYDYLGWFIIFYTESTGVAVNITTSVTAIVAVALSIYQMSRCNKAVKAKHFWLESVQILGIQLLSVLAAAGLTIVIGVIVNALGLTQSWYAAEWMIFGLYFCPLFFGLGLIPAIYIHLRKKKTNLPIDNTIACFLNSHSIILACVCIVMTAMNIRSSFFVMLGVFFYTIGLILNMLVTHFMKKNWFLWIHLLVQILPYWFYTYLTFAFFKTFVPMQGRDGPNSNPELFISGFSAIMGIHFAGFILPVLLKFRKSKIFFSLFGVLTVVFVIIAATSAGFPYRKHTHPQRFFVLHSNRIIHEYGGNVVKNNSGFYVLPCDTRPHSLDDTTLAKAMPDSWTYEECETELICGLPNYSSGWFRWRSTNRWIEAPAPLINVPVELTLKSKTQVSSTNTLYEFSLQAANRVVIVIDPLPNIKIVDWSFPITPLTNGYNSPYFTFNVNLIDEPLEFRIEVQRNDIHNDGPTIRIGTSSHLLYHSHLYTQEFKDFMHTFPEWTYPSEWIGHFESWIF